MSGSPLPARLHAEAILALATALLFSGPFAKHLVTSLTRQNPRKSENAYEDQDGRSRPEDVAKFSTRRPRALVAIFAATGCFVSIYISALETINSSRCSLLANTWLYSAAWVCSVGANYRSLSADRRFETDCSRFRCRLFVCMQRLRPRL